MTDNSNFEAHPQKGAGKVNVAMTEGPSSRSWMAVLAAIVAVLFGLLTLKSGGSVLFIDGPDRAAAGNYVPFVLWFNFLAGFVYIIAGTGLFLGRVWAVNLSLLIALVTLLVFVAFGVHIIIDGEYETRTVGAMIMRSSVWLVIGFFSRRAWKRGAFQR